MSALIEGLHLDWKLITEQALNFLVLLAILTKFVYKPIFRILNERRLNIESSLQKAEEIDKKMEDIKQYHQDQLIKARDEAQQIIAQAREMADKEKEKKLAKTEEEVAMLFERAKTEISAEKKEMVKDVERQTTKFLIPAIDKILKETVDEPIRKQIQEKSVKKVAQLYNQ